MIYEYLDYREYIKAEIHLRKKMDKGKNFNALAKALGLSTPQLSKVIHGWQHFNRDHIYQASKFLRLSEDQSNYLEDLHDYNTSEVKQRRQSIRSRIERVRQKRLQTKQYIQNQTSNVSAGSSLNEYYLDHMHQLVHMAVCIPRYQNDMRQLALDLSLPKEMVFRSLEKLEHLGVIEKRSSRYVDLAPSLHLSPDSSYFRPWIQLIRLASAQQLQKLPHENSYAFAGTFTADENAKEKIQMLFLRFLKSAQEIAEESVDENIYQINFDLFGWTQN